MYTHVVQHAVCCMEADGRIKIHGFVFNDDDRIAVPPPPRCAAAAAVGYNNNIPNDWHLTQQTQRCAAGPPAKKVMGIDLTSARAAKKGGAASV